MMVNCCVSDEALAQNVLLLWTELYLCVGQVSGDALCSVQTEENSHVPSHMHTHIKYCSNCILAQNKTEHDQLYL